MPEYKTTLSLSGAYRLDEALLQDLFQHAQAFVESKLSVRIECSDVHSLESNSLSEILRDSLLRMEVITEISIGGYSHSGLLRRFQFRARALEYVPTISIDIEGRQDSCRALGSHIEGLLRAKRQWYSPIIPSGRFSVALATATATGIVILATPPMLARIFAPSLVGPLVVSAIIGLFPCLALAYWLRRLLFPQLIVEIGQSAAIATRARGLRKFLFGGVLVALLIGIAASLIANALSK